MPKFLKLLLQLAILAAGTSGIIAFHPTLTRRGILLWQVQLSPDECGKANWNPCYNVYAVNVTHGDLVWFAFTTSSSAVKGMFLGHHSVYYTTWSGPGLYSVNAANGHVRWQFPLDNWFRYWVKDIDLDHSASFGVSDEVLDYVYVTAAGPPARLYGLRTKSGSRQWEYKVPQQGAALAGLTGPLQGSKGRATVFMALNQHSSNSSWLQALTTATGSLVWQSAALNGTLLGRVELQEDDGVVLATTAAADAILAFDALNGSLLWSRPGNFCSTPSPILDVYKGRLLLSEKCDDLSGLTAVDLLTGRELWGPWLGPGAAQPLGNCSSYSQAGGSIFFGCSCYTKGRWHWEEQDSNGHAYSSSSSGTKQQAGSSSTRSSSNSRTQLHSAAAASAHEANGVCLYALNTRTGRLRWVLPMAGNASFPTDAQRWGMAPLIHGNLVLLLATDRILAADMSTGKLRWSLQLPRFELLQAFEQPVVDPDSSTLVLAAKLQGSNKTGISGVALREGRLLWHKTVNGTVQHAGSPADGPQELMVTGARVYIEACRGSRCCLRALNVTTGKQWWGMCLDAVQGDDATHPHAQFAIWFITLVTICSIALLILGAGLVYIQRWSEERRILYGAAAPSSPRHSYQPLPPRASDSEDG